MSHPAATLSEQPFAIAAERAWDTTAPGVRRKIMVHGPDLMLVRVEFEQGAIGARHHHPHRQATYVLSGRFRATIGAESRELVAGDCFFAAADVPHDVEALDAGALLDAFTPRRDDFLGA